MSKSFKKEIFYLLISKRILTIIQTTMSLIKILLIIKLLKMKYIFILPILLLTINNLVLANNVSENKAKQIANNYYSFKNPDKNAVVIKSVTRTHNENVCLYLFYFNTGGFVMVPGNDAAVPVLGYSLKGNFDENEDLPPAFEYMIENYCIQIDYITNNDLSNSSTIHLWNDILNKRYQNKNNNKVVSPLLESVGAYPIEYAQFKNQSNECEPGSYNDKCPIDDKGHCGNAKAGCGAVAMAQVMRYWQHPETGRGYKGYNQLLHPQYGWIEADFGSTTYDWENMPFYLINNSDEEEIEAVTTLIYHCGVSIWMHYGHDFSWALAQNIPEALVDNFRYSAANLKKRKNYSDNEWKNKLRDELDLLHPIIYYGDKEHLSKYKHYFVCDGYGLDGDNNYFHFNWGWDGSHNGYFYIDDLDPKNNGNHYNKHQKAIFDVDNGCLPHYYLADYIEAGEAKAIQASNTITVAYGDDTFIIEGENQNQEFGTCVFIAGQSVFLHQGFHARIGSSFHASIGECETKAGQNKTVNNKVTSISNSNLNIQNNLPSIHIYPNPNNGEFTIDVFGDVETKGSFEIYNSVGVLIDRGVSSNKTQIDISNNSKGLYIIKIRTPDKQFVEKVFVQ